MPLKKPDILVLLFFFLHSTDKEQIRDNLIKTGRPVYN